MTVTSGLELLLPTTRHTAAGAMRNYYLQSKDLNNSDNGKESMWEEGTRDGDTEEMWGERKGEREKKKSISSEEEDFRSAPTSINWESRRSGFFPIHRVEEHGVEEEEGLARGFEAPLAWSLLLEYTHTTAAAGSPLPITSLQPKGCLRTARRACSDSTFLHHPLQLANGGADRKKTKERKNNLDYPAQD